MKFHFYTLGCKVNLFETQALMQLAQERGHEIVPCDADAVVINTCTVTGVGDHKNIRAFHKLRRENPCAVIAACGCFAQIAPEEVLAGGEIDLLCGTSDRVQILARCEEAVRSGVPAQDNPPAPSRTFEALPAGIPQGRTRALLKIEDGCDNYCTYCIIPYARGHVRSLPPEAVWQQALQLAEQGVREVVLTGIEIAAYGRDLAGDIALLSLLDRLCSALPQVRFRLSSLEPRVITAAFCETMGRHQNLARHFHLSLQSGCDSVLERMHRRYTTVQFAEKLSLLRSVFPDCAITADVIVGFPGETDAEFDDTMTFLRSCGFAALHVFPYSKRSGTVAAAMEEQVPEEQKEARVQSVRALAKTMQTAFRQRFIGRTLPVLLEHPLPDGCWSGHSDYDFQIAVKTGHGAKNKVAVVLLEQLGEERILGREVSG